MQAREIQSADPAARHRAIILVGATAAIGTALIYAATSRQAQLIAWLEQHLDVALRFPAIGLAVGFALTAPLLGAAAYLFLHGRRVVVSRRWPPPGQSVVRDTPVTHGMMAVYRGRVLQILASAMALVGSAIPLLLWQLLRTLGAP